MALFDGKLDAIDLMAIEYEQQRKERKEKLNYIVRAVRESNDNTFDITPLCRNLDITLTADEFNWILKQVNDD